jgi:hypothetical protein
MGRKRARRTGQIKDSIAEKVRGGEGRGCMDSSLVT